MKTINAISIISNICSLIFCYLLLFHQQIDPRPLVNQEWSVDNWYIKIFALIFIGFSLERLLRYIFVSRKRKQFKILLKEIEKNILQGKGISNGQYTELKYLDKTNKKESFEEYRNRQKT